MGRKKFAILVGQPDEEYQTRFIEGFLGKAYKDDFDACIFSMYRKYQDNEVREKGESNIFNLINYDMFEAVVILKDTIQTAGVAEAIEEKLLESYKKPVVVVEYESKHFHSIQTDGYAGMYNMVSHMIEVHGYKDIAFLAGKKWHSHSIQRTNAYKDAMRDHGLEFKDEWIMYGDFWYKSGEQWADRLLQNPDELPEAVVCANDCMAIGLARV
nr:substrate-binding domain-containing protein [Lachnospiraceae bacterium]